MSTNLPKGFLDEDTTSNSMASAAVEATYDALSYKSMTLLTERRRAGGEVGLVYTTVTTPGDAPVWRATYRVPAAVWERLAQVYAPFHNAANQHFGGNWPTPSNRDLVARIRHGDKPAGHVVFDMRSLEELDQYLVGLLANVAAGEVPESSGLDVAEVPAAEHHRAFLVGRRRPLRTMMDWAGLVEATAAVGHPVPDELGDSFPLDLLKGRDWAYPQGEEGHWKTGLALGYPFAATIAMLAGTVDYADFY